MILALAAIRVLEALFFLGMIGSVVVILISFVQDGKEFIGKEAHLPNRPPCCRRSGRQFPLELRKANASCPTDSVRTSDPRVPETANSFEIPAPLKSPRI